MSDSSISVFPPGFAAYHCLTAGCPARLSVRIDPESGIAVVQHGPNPEHVIILQDSDERGTTLQQADRVFDWLERIHALPRGTRP